MWARHLQVTGHVTGPLPVLTGGRRESRTVGGFADHLRLLA